MPILPKEPDCYPGNLLDSRLCRSGGWWLLYTKSRQEKQLMRHLREQQLPHYGPLVRVRRRSPAGRIRTSYAPLFTSYVFLCGDNAARYKAVCTGCVQKATEVTEIGPFVGDLIQVRNLIEMGVPLTIESRMKAGEPVRIRNGPFAGYEGEILRRENETRLLVSVRFMEQGVSVKLEDSQLESIA